MLEHVEPGAGDPPFLKGRDQRRLVDDLAARGVDQIGVALHQPKTLGIDNVVRLGRVRTVDGDDVHPAEHCVQRRPPRRLQRLLDRFRQTLAVMVMEDSEEHTSELQSLMRISYAVFCLKKKRIKNISQLQKRSG